MLKNQSNKWHKGQVIHGSKQGRTISYPTANIDLAEAKLNIEKGVYAALVKIKDKKYKGLLYYGPRLVQNETFDVCEVYILDFDDQIYDAPVEFQLIEFIRGVMDFDSMEELKSQIDLDLKKSEEIFNKF